MYTPLKANSGVLFNHTLLNFRLWVELVYFLRTGLIFINLVRTGLSFFFIRTGFWIDSERVLHQYNNDAPFCIINPQVKQN